MRGPSMTSMFKSAIDDLKGSDDNLARNTRCGLSSEKMIRSGLTVWLLNPINNSFKYAGLYAGITVVILMETSRACRVAALASLASLRRIFDEIGMVAIIRDDPSAKRIQHRHFAHIYLDELCGRLLDLGTVFASKIARDTGLEDYPLLPGIEPGARDTRFQRRTGQWRAQLKSYCRSDEMWRSPDRVQPTAGLATRNAKCSDGTTSSPLGCAKKLTRFLLDFPGKIATQRAYVQRLVRIPSTQIGGVIPCP